MYRCETAEINTAEEKVEARARAHVKVRVYELPDSEAYWRISRLSSALP